MIQSESQNAGSMLKHFSCIKILEYFTNFLNTEVTTYKQSKF